MSRTTISACAAGLLLLQSMAFGANDVNSKKGIASNDFRLLSASSDTLAVCSFGASTFAVNYFGSNGDVGQKVVDDANWTSYQVNDGELYTIAYGAGRTVVCYDSSDKDSESINKIRVINHTTGTTTTLTFPFDSLDGSYQIFTNDVAYFQNSFYFAYLDGRLIRWNLQDDSKSVYVPESTTVTPTNSFKGIDAPESKQVISVETAPGKLIVTTRSQVFLFSPADTSWEKLGSTLLKINNTLSVQLKAFNAAFADTLSDSLQLYCFADVSIQGRDADTSVLCKYSASEQGWRVLMDVPIYGITFGTNNYLYTIENGNSIRAYRDTLKDSSIVFNPNPENEYSIISRMTLPYGISEPSMINDIQFIPRTDSSGILWVATSDGLFVSPNEIPGKSKDAFLLIKRAPDVKKGLKKVYARPGVLKSDYNNGTESKAVFIYNVSKNAKVTIRIYDYNMDLVRTIIEKQPRKPGDDGGPFGRSSVEKEDCWDGTNRYGKTVAPGVYYFKITTDIGESAFGKIVVAK